MPQNSLAVSETGQKKIKQAIEDKKLRVRVGDTRVVIAASEYFIEQYKKAHSLGDNDRRWPQDFEQIFRIKRNRPKAKDKNLNIDKNKVKIEREDRINQIKIKLARNGSTTYLKNIQEMIGNQELYVRGISYGSWSKFASQTKRNSINSDAFKAYCHILGLDWQEIAETDDRLDADLCLEGTIAYGEFHQEIHRNFCELLKKISVEKHLNRQVSQLLLLVEKHGGKDWKEWQDYQELEAQ